MFVPIECSFRLIIVRVYMCVIAIGGLQVELLSSVVRALGGGLSHSVTPLGITASLVSSAQTSSRPIRCALQASLLRPDDFVAACWLYGAGHDRDVSHRRAQSFP